MTYKQIKEQIRKLGFMTEKDFALKFGQSLYEDVNDIIFELASVQPVERRISLKRQKTEDETDFDFSELLGSDFLRFSESPITEENTGKTLTDVRFLTASVIHFPKEATGVFSVPYIKNPSVIKSEDDTDFVPDISEEAQRIISPGTAARIYINALPKEAEKYSETFENLKQTLSSPTARSYIWEDTNRWL